MKKAVIVIISALLMASGGTAPASLEGIDLIKETIKKYNATPALKVRMKKEVKLSLLEQTRTSEGLLYFSKGLMRLETKKPEESTIVLNDEAIWVETKVDGFDGITTHVTKIASKDLKKRSKAPLVLLLTRTEAWDFFEVIDSKRSELARTLTLKPRKKESYPELTKVRISINTETKELWYLSYYDEIENEVTYKFQRPDFDAEISQSKFKYQPPKGAEVVVY